jgi:hypothetical protein
MLLLFGLAPLLADTPITPGASPEAQALFAFLEHTYGRNIIAGQHEGWRGTNELGPELRRIQQVSGRLPALLSLDLAPYTRGRTARRPERPDITDHAIDWSVNRHGLVSLCWHWTAPMNEPAFYTKDTAFDVARAVTPGTPEYAATLRDIDRIAGELERLRDAHVPVLWRPLHEANGRWFWWGAGGPEPFKQLWQLLFARLTEQHHLTNLIWVFSPGAGIDLADWYPGDAFVDLVAPDHYPLDHNHGPARDIFTEMVALTGGVKPVGFGENGPLPAPFSLTQEKAGWLFFIAWSGQTFNDNNTADQIRETYAAPDVLTLEDLPDLKRYPVAVVGQPARLAFRPPPDFAIDSPARRPLVVAVQDAAGQTVREGHHRVRLTLGAHPNKAGLRGTTTVTSTNGIAVFSDLAINRAGEHYTLEASVEGLPGATSPAFRVGPGDGIVRESWAYGGTQLPAMAALASHPANVTRLGRALETPVALATNFVARYRGYVLPPATGDYVFQVASASAVQFWLGTDATTTNKSVIVEINGSTPYAKWPHTNEAQSRAVHLEADRRYYLEIVQRQPAGSTHLCVRWRLPNGRMEGPIPGSRLASIADAATTDHNSAP